MITISRAWAALTGSVIATMAIVETVPKPVQVWPDSWVGFASATTVILGAITAVVTRIMGLHRWGQKGLYDKLDQMERARLGTAVAHQKELEAMREAAKEVAEAARGEMRAMQEHFDSELIELQQHYDKEIVALRQDTDTKLNLFTNAVKERMDGFGLRVERGEVRLGHVEGEQRTSAEDRRHISQKLDRLEILMDRMLERMGPAR